MDEAKKGVAYERRELEVIADEDEFIGIAQGTETCGKSNLRGFVDNTIVKGTTRKENARQCISDY